jgi:inosine-uridine nucleoside N-ribohydrolase
MPETSEHGLAAAELQGSSTRRDAVRVILDTDLGNDIDDVFALAMLHALHDRGECQLLATTVSKNHPLAGPFCDVLNTFYGRGDTPIGTLQTGPPSGDGPYLPAVMQNGSQMFPHDLANSSDAPNAVDVLRQTLASQPDHSVLVIAVGPLTNLAALLDSPADRFSPLAGAELAGRKVKQLVAMAGDFSRPKAEFNVETDGPAAARVIADWPGEIVVCPFEMGESVHYPGETLADDFQFAEQHPVRAAALATFGKLNGFMAWDLVAVLYAIRPERKYFGLSGPGRITLDRDNVTRHEAAAGGLHRYLMPSPGELSRTREALSHLCSQPPVLRPALMP